MKAAQAATRSSQFIDYLSRKKSYLLGVFLGIALVVINMYIGLSMTNLLLDDPQVEFEPGTSLPVINVQDYNKVKEEYLSRQERVLLKDFLEDPFRI